MNYIIFTGYVPCTLKVSVSSLNPVTLKLVCFDRDQVNTLFTNRQNTFKGKQVFYIRMPLSPKNAIVQIYDMTVGNMPEGGTTTFKVDNIEKLGLERRTDIAGITNPQVASFAAFNQRFSYNAGVLAAPMMYLSDDKQFKINYQAAIIGKNGNELATPARISKKTGIIDVSQHLMVRMTVPGRVAVLFHEFAHLYLNKNMYSEKEADMNALMIYLGLGYPRIEAYEVFLDTFYNAATGANWNRYEAIEKFINEYEDLNFVIK